MSCVISIYLFSACATHNCQVNMHTLIKKMEVSLSSSFYAIYGNGM